MAVGSDKIGDIHPVSGIRLAAVEANIRYADRLDLVLIEIAAQSTVAGVFTQNAFCAAPVKVAKQHLQNTNSRYFLINTGNANAGTGNRGEQAARRCCQAVADIGNTKLEQVLPFSTGVIGENLPSEKILSALPDVYKKLSASSWREAALGILTTDTRPKIASLQLTLGEQKLNITGIAKGSGMIKPNLATMLGFIFTDAEIDQQMLLSLLQGAADGSFNRLTVDGDTSTNDACMLVATGTSKVKIQHTDSPNYTSFQQGLYRVFRELATGMIKDAEGATKFITINVIQGATQQECLQVAYAVAESPLVKTACFAADPNWGRILAAVGRAGVKDLDVEAVSIFLGDTCLVDRGSLDASYVEAQGQAEMDKDEIIVVIKLARGEYSETVWTSDLSHEYVRINAEYRT